MAKIEIEPTTLNWIKNQNKGLQPTGTINITENGTYDVTNYAEAEVLTPVPTGTINITANGNNIDVSSYASANVNVQATSEYNAKYEFPSNTTQYDMLYTRITKIDTITIPSTITSLYQTLARA